MLFSKTCTLLLAVGVSFTSSLPWDRVDSPAAAAAEGGVATALLLQDQGGDDPRPDNPLPETMTLEDELPSDMVVADTNGNEGSLFDGDYMLSKSQALALIGEEATKELENAGFVFRHKKGRSGRDLSILDNVVNGIGLWTNRTEDGRLRVPISISTSGNTFSPSQISVIKLGMDMIEETGVVKFVERTTESDFIDFFKTQGGPCWSNGPGLFLDSEEGSNIIGLSTNCFLPGIIAHEILHALGFVHEQSRTDRDEHVIINEENIVENGYAQKAYTKLQTDSLGTPYDFGSIMHYQQRTFRKSKGLKTFDVRGELPPDIVFIGQRSRLSHGDAQRLRVSQQVAFCSSSNLKPLFAAHQLSLFFLFKISISTNVLLALERRQNMKLNPARKTAHAGMELWKPATRTVNAKAICSAAHMSSNPRKDVRIYRFQTIKQANSRHVPTLITMVTTPVPVPWLANFAATFARSPALTNPSQSCPPRCACPRLASLDNGTLISNSASAPAATLGSRPGTAAMMLVPVPYPKSLTI